MSNGYGMLSTHVTVSLCMPSLLTTVRLAYLMPLLVYNYVVESHDPHTAQGICRIPGTSTYTCQMHAEAFSLLCSSAAVEHTGMFVGLQHNNTMCSGWGSYCLHISSLVAAV